MKSRVIHDPAFLALSKEKNAPGNLPPAGAVFQRFCNHPESLAPTLCLTY
jgi:hypothetical protein